MTEHRCQEPGCKGPAPRAWIKKQIKRVGVAVINVFDDDGHWFHYTIGNHSASLPELLLIGGTQQTGGALIDLAKIMRERKSAFTDGELVSLGGKYPVKVIGFDELDAAAVRDEYTAQTFNYYGTDGYRVQQILMPDREGRYPGDPACAEPYASFQDVRVRAIRH
jgi:hypothetical protein